MNAQLLNGHFGLSTEKQHRPPSAFRDGTKNISQEEINPVWVKMAIYILLKRRKVE